MLLVVLGIVADPRGNFRSAILRSYAEVTTETSSRRQRLGPASSATCCVLLAEGSFLIELELRVYWELLSVSQAYIKREKKTANTPTQIGPIYIASFL
jgi:hypothetical protein